MTFELLHTKPADVAFWSGAGISAGPPTSLPLGDDLTQALIESYCGSDTWIELKGEFSDLKMRDDNGLVKESPRLESTLETLLSSMGPSCLNLLKILDRPVNNSHDFFAAHLAYGGDHITLNLDDCIVKSLRYFLSDQSIAIIDALQDVTPPPIHSDVPILVHVHGRIPSGTTPTNALGLGSKNISAGLSPLARWSIETILKRRTWLVVVGYSGRDYFDVNPYLRELEQLRPSHSNLNVLWVNYCVTGNLSNLRRYQVRSSIAGSLFLESLRTCGAKVWVCNMDPTRLYEELAYAWSIPQRPATTGARLSRDAIKANAAPVTPDQRRLNAAALWVSMGFGQKAVRELRHINHQNPTWSHHCCHPWGFSSNAQFVAFVANEAYRELGLYRSATDALNWVQWTRGLDPLICLHREGGDRWLEGRPVASYVLLSRALHRGVRMLHQHSGVRKEIQANLIETSVRLLHLYRDTARHFPLLRLFPIPGVRLALLLLCSEGENLRNLLYDVWHINRLGVELGGPVANQLSHLSRGLPSSRSSVFPETDNVLGYINTKRFELVQQKSSTVCDWEEVIRLSMQIGDIPGQIKGTIEMGRIHPLDDAKKITCREAVIAVQWSWILRRRWLRALASV